MNVKKLVAATSAVLIAAQSMINLTFGLSYQEELQQAFEWAKQIGLTNANSLADFEPTAQLSRGTAAKLFAIFGEKVLGLQPDPSRACQFDDIAGKWYADYAIKACKLGLMKGSNGHFYGERKLYKSEAVVVLARAAARKMLDWNDAIRYAQEHGITHETNVANLYRPVTKAELVIMEKRVAEQLGATTQQQEQTQQEENNVDINNLLGSLLGGNEEETGNTNEQTTSSEQATTEQQTQTTNEQEQTQEQTTTEEETTTGTQEDVLEVALDPDTPREQYVPGTGSHIRVMKFDLEAGSKDVKVKAITVTLKGLVDRNHIANVYIEDEDGTVLTNQREFGVDYTARLVFNGDYVVPANTVKKLYVAIDTKGSVNEIIKIAIEKPSDIEATSEVKGNFPIESYPIHTTSYSSETLTVVGLKQDVTNTYYVGDKNKEIGVFKFEVGSQTQKDVILKSVRFKSEGDSLEGRIDNAKLVVNGENIAKDVIIDGKYITFVINDYVIPYGTTRTFYVYADIVGGEDGDHFRLKLDENSDISAIEKDTNAAVAVSGKGTYSELNNIKEGDNLITKSSESPTSEYIPNDADDITVLVANVSISNPMQVDKFKIPFKVLSGGVTDVCNAAGISRVKDDVKRVKLYINDKLVDVTDTIEYDNSGNCYVEFSYYDILKGSNKFVVKVDTNTNAHDGDVLKSFVIDGNSFVDAEYVSTHNTVDPSDIKGVAESATFTIRTPKIVSVTRNDGYSNPDTLIAGVKDFELMKVAVQANNVRDLKINNITVEISGTADNYNNSYLSTLKLVDENGNVKDVENVSSNSVTFDTLDITVPKGGTVKFSILADTTTNLTGKLQIIVKSIDYEDTNGNSYTWNGNVPSVVWEVKESAHIYATIDSDTPDEGLIPAKSDTEYEVARFKFKATDDDAEIQELTLVNVNTNFTGDYATGTTPRNTDADKVVSDVVLYDTNGNKLADASLVSGVAYFALDNPIKLPRDKDVVIIVKIKPNTIDDTGTDNKYVRFTVLEPGYDIDTKKTKIVSVANGDEITDSNYLTFDNVVANPQFIRATVIHLADVAQENTSLDAGYNDIYKFTVTADQAGAAKVKEFRFDVTVTDSTSDDSTGFNINNFEFWKGDTNLNDNGDVTFEYATGTCASVTGGDFVAVTDTTKLGVAGTSQAYCVRAILTGSYVDGYEITAGSDVTFKLRANAENVATNDSVSVRLNEVANDATVMDTYNNVANGSVSIVWSDEAADNVTLSTDNWFNDKDVEVLPLNSWTLSK